MGLARRKTFGPENAKPELKAPDPKREAGDQDQTIRFFVGDDIRDAAARKGVAASLDRLVSIARRKESFVPSEARRYDRILASLYRTIDKAVKGWPEEEAVRFVASTLEAVDALAGGISRPDELIAAVAPAVGLIEIGVRLGDRRVLALPPEEAADAAAAAPGFIGELLGSLEGRASAGTALAVLPNLVEQLEMRAGAESADQRRELWEKAARYLVDTSPRHGFDQGTVGELAGRLAAALRREEDVDDAIASARTAFHEARAPGIDEARARIEGTPEPVKGALLQILDANRAAPEALLSALVSASEHGEALEPHAAFIASLAERSAATSALEMLVEGLDPKRLGPYETDVELQVALAVGGRDTPKEAELREATLAYAKAHPLSDPVPELRAFADRWLAAADVLDDPPVASAIAASPYAADVGFVRQVVEHLPPVEQAFPKLERTAIAGALAELFDPNRTNFSPPEDLLDSLLQEAAPLVAKDPKKQTVLFDLAVRLSRTMAEIADTGPLFNRVRQDWAEAIQHPEKLGKGGAMPQVALRAQNAVPSIGGFLEQYPELPLEAALTIGMHLSGDRFAWVSSQMEKTRQQDRLRALRDMVAACVDADRLGFIDTVRDAPASKKAIARAIDEVAKAFRENKLEEVPFDDWARALMEGRDPVFEREQASIEKTLAELNLQELADGPLDPEGVADILACKKQIAVMLERFVEGARAPTDTQYDLGCLRPVVMETLRSAASGAWPDVRYENEVGKRMMARLTPRQRQIWRKTSVTYATPPADAEADQAWLGQARVLLGGLERAMPQTLPLGEGLDWNEASLAKVRAAHSEAVDEVHHVPKGSEAHKAAGRKLGELTEALAFLELHHRLANLGDEVGAATLRDLAPLLESARARAKRHSTAEGLVEIVDRVLDGIRRLQGVATEGKYAADEDSLEALWTANQTGCLSVSGGASRIWGLPGAASDANIKRLRVYDGDRQTFRATMRFFPVKMDGYEGMALFVDNPKPDGGGGVEDRNLIHRHVLEKALEMGIPVMAGGLYQNSYTGWAELAKEGEARGLEVKRNLQVECFFEEGHTPYSHSDCLMNDGHGGTNFIGWIAKHRGDNEFWERSLDIQTVVMPTPAGA